MTTLIVQYYWNVNNNDNKQQITIKLQEIFAYLCHKTLRNIYGFHIAVKFHYKCHNID
jgi:hypothetical protein